MLSNVKRMIRRMFLTLLTVVRDINIYNIYIYILTHTLKAAVQG